MTEDLALRQTYYAAFFAAHVAVIAIALPVAAAFLLPQAERYSARLLGTLLADRVFLLLLLLILASVLPSAAGLYFSVAPAADPSNVIPGVVLWTFVGAVLAFLVLFERTRRVVQPRALVRRAVEAVRDEDWYGKALARFGSRRYDKPISAALQAALARALAPSADGEGAVPNAGDQAPAEDREAPKVAARGGGSEAERAQQPEAHGQKEQDEEDEEDEEEGGSEDERRLLARRERLLETHTQREDALAGATSIALRAIDDHDMWTLGAYASALRDAVLARVGAATAITTYTAEDVAVALVQLACHDHLTPLFALAIRSDLRAARILLETMQEIAVGALSTHPKVASHVVARLDNWLDDALREHASEELIARWLRVLGVTGREAARVGTGSVATHVVQALTHAGEVLPSAFWTDAPHVYNHPEVAERLRQGEALGLRWSDIDLDGRALRIRLALQRVPQKGLQLVEPKTTSSRRTLVLPEVVVRALRQHRNRQIEERLAAGERWRDHDFVFTTFDGTPLSASNVVRRSFRKICRRADIGHLRFHDLRHSAATLLLAQGVPQRVVMEQLGHSTLAMTQRYTHVVPQLMKDAAAAMDRALGS